MPLLLVIPSPYIDPLYSDLAVDWHRGHKHDTVMGGADGNTTEQPQSHSSSQPRSQPQSSSPTAPVQFTFINQHSDIHSVRERRIKNDDHRHQIRSHVMRNVRLTEHHQGVKRPTGRAAGRTKSRDRKTSTARSSTTTSLDSESKDDGAINRESPTLEVVPFGDTSTLTRMRSHPSPILYASPSTNHYVDPFNQLPGNTLGHTATESLLRYCFKVFLPMTFPVESKLVHEEMARRQLVRHAQDGKPATFSGFLATFASHRAIMYGHHNGSGLGVRGNGEGITDPEYKRAHNDAIMAIKVKVDRGEMDSDFLEACFAHISTTTMVGDFERTRHHLDSMQKVLKYKENPVAVPEVAKAWLPLADIKAALGTLDRPRIGIPWDRVPVSDETLQRVRPVSGSPFSRMALSFLEVPGLSGRLLELVQEAALICQMCEFNARHVYGLTEDEHTAFRCKSLELEHDLLAYVFVEFGRNDGEGETEIATETVVPVIVPAAEEIVRLAILGILSTICVHVLPGCGLGRAITMHQMRATRRWLASEEEQARRRGQYRVQMLNDPTAKMVTWALFVFVHCAKDQGEAPQFKAILLEVVKRLWLLNFEEVEATVFGFLYVPSVMRPTWSMIWDDVESWRRRQEATTPTMVERVVR